MWACVPLWIRLGVSVYTLWLSGKTSNSQWWWGGVDCHHVSSTWNSDVTPALLCSPKGARLWLPHPNATDFNVSNTPRSRIQDPESPEFRERRQSLRRTGTLARMRGSHWKFKPVGRGPWGNYLVFCFHCCRHLKSPKPCGFPTEGFSEGIVASRCWLFLPP